MTTLEPSIFCASWPVWGTSTLFQLYAHLRGMGIR
jgi:hypothetical protein